MLTRYFYSRLIYGKNSLVFHFLKIEMPDCKCQAFITHNLFISSLWRRARAQWCVHDEWLRNSFLALLFAQFLRSPAVRHSLVVRGSPCDIVIVCGRRKWKVRKNFTPSSCQISQSLLNSFLPVQRTWRSIGTRCTGRYIVTAKLCANCLQKFIKLILNFKWKDAQINKINLRLFNGVFVEKRQRKNMQPDWSSSCKDNSASKLRPLKL